MAYNIRLTNGDILVIISHRTIPAMLFAFVFAQPQIRRKEIRKIMSTLGPDCSSFISEHQDAIHKAVSSINLGKPLKPVDFYMEDNMPCVYQLEKMANSTKLVRNTQLTPKASKLKDLYGGIVRVHNPPSNSLGKRMATGVIGAFVTVLTVSLLLSAYLGMLFAALFLLRIGFLVLFFSPLTFVGVVVSWYTCKYCIDEVNAETVYGKEERTMRYKLTKLTPKALWITAPQWLSTRDGRVELKNLARPVKVDMNGVNVKKLASIMTEDAPKEMAKLALSSDMMGKVYDLGWRDKVSYLVTDPSAYRGEIDDGLKEIELNRSGKLGSRLGIELWKAMKRPSIDE